MPMVTDADSHRVAMTYLGHVERLPSMSVEEKCHVLLAAREIGLESPALSSALQDVVAYVVSPDHEPKKIVLVCLRQLVLVLFEQAPPLRQMFLRRWIAGGLVRHEEPVTKTWVYGLGAENFALLDEGLASAVTRWFQNNYEVVEAWRARCWMPHYLSLCSYQDDARASADALLAGRDRHAGWGEDVRKTTAVAYALVYSGVVAGADLEATLAYLAKKLRRGWAGDLSQDCTMLKLLHRTGELPALVRDELAARARDLGPHREAVHDIGDRLTRIEENVGILGNPDVQEMLEDQAAGHVLAKDKKLLQTRFQRVAKGVAAEVKKRAGGKLWDSLEGEVDDGVAGLLGDEDREDR